MKNLGITVAKFEFAVLVRLKDKKNIISEFARTDITKQHREVA